MRHAALLLALFAGGCGGGEDPRRAALGPNPSLAARMAVADAGRGRRLFGACAACHTIAAGGLDRNGPNLHGVMGRSIAAGSRRYPYTAALQAKGGRWTEAAMDEWLAAPTGFAPGTRMAIPGVADPLDRADLIAWLRAAP